MSLSSALSRAYVEASGELSVLHLDDSFEAGSELDYGELMRWIEAQFRSERLSRAIRLVTPSGNSFDYAISNADLFCLFLRDTRLERVRFKAEGYYVFRLLTDGGMQQRLGRELRDMEGFDSSILSPGDTSMGWSSSTRASQGATGVVIFCKSSALRQKLLHLRSPSEALERALSSDSEFSYSRTNVPCTQAMMRFGNELLELDLAAEVSLLQVEGLAHLAIAEFLRSLASTRVKASSFTQISSRDAQRLDEAREYARAHFRDALTVSQLARRVGLNRTKLNDGFRELFGTSVHGFIVEQRMDTALELLRDDPSLQEIAEKTGYSSSASFSRAFKSHFGSSPGEYRQAAE